MSDKIEQIGESLLQYGKSNNRVYIIKMDKQNIDTVQHKAVELCERNEYTKIFAKINSNYLHGFIEQGYIVEASIPNFYSDGADSCFIAKYIDEERIVDKQISEVKKTLKLSFNKQIMNQPVKIPEEFSLAILSKEDITQMVSVFSTVFDSYPFPIFDPQFIAETMDSRTIYAGIKHNGKIVSIASAEMDEDFYSAEMTDFATLPDFRGNSFASILLSFLEEQMKKIDLFQLYTIARAYSPGMNITFKKGGYNFAGTLINNTNISGNIESMNVWYKKLN